MFASESPKLVIFSRSKLVIFIVTLIDVSPEEEEHIKKILEKEIFESLASDEVETPEAFVERLNRKYYLSSYKSTMQKAIEEKFFRYKIKIE